MPRFVLLYHECPPGYERASHWDLMLESGPALRTWALAELPSAWQTDQMPSDPSVEAIAADELADHRLAYLDYEGPVSDERGVVQRVDAGTYETLAQSPNGWEVALHGGLLCGRLKLCRGAAAQRQWTLTIESPD